MAFIVWNKSFASPSALFRVWRLNVIVNKDDDRAACNYNANKQQLDLWSREEGVHKFNTAELVLQMVTLL